MTLTNIIMQNHCRKYILNMRQVIPYMVRYAPILHYLYPNGGSLKFTNLILILFAAGLITYGIHELIEAGVVNPIIQEVWNIKHILPESFPDGNVATPEWLEVIGSLLKALFGYNANPSLLEVIIYPSLLISIGLISLKLWKRSNDIIVMELKEEQPKLS